MAASPFVKVTRSTGCRPPSLELILGSRPIGAVMWSTGRRERRAGARTSGMFAGLPDHLRSSDARARRPDGRAAQCRVVSCGHNWKLTTRWKERQPSVLAVRRRLDIEGCGPKAHACGLRAMLDGAFTLGQLVHAPEAANIAPQRIEIRSNEGRTGSQMRAHAASIAAIPGSGVSRPWTHPRSALPHASQYWKLWRLARRMASSADAAASCGFPHNWAHAGGKTVHIANAEGVARCVCLF